MEYFWSQSGHQPRFKYRVQVPRCTTEMHLWCEAYDSQGQPFRRYHVEWKKVNPDREYEVVQFEWEQAAIMFALKFGISS